MAKTQKSGVVEDFKPASEWKEELENNILIVHLPDFTKEQIKITCVKSTRMVRVHGDRKLASNKWSRVNEGFPIPENCKIDKINAKWHDGSLTVIMPKEIITTTAPPDAPKTPKDKEATSHPPKTAPEPSMPSKQVAAATSGRMISNEQNKYSEFMPSPRANVRNAFNAHQKDEKNSKQPQKGTEETSKKHTSTANTTTKQTDHHDKTNTVVQPKPGNHVEHYNKEKNDEAKKEIIPSDQLKKPENVMDTTTTSFKESHVVPKTASEKGKEKNDKSKEEAAKEKKSIAAGALKAVMEQNEERQLMVNIGVAVLVIVSLGAYISYSLSSKSKSSGS